MEDNIIYLDIVWLINFIMDFVLIWATGMLRGIKVNFFRITLAALVGSCYTLALFLPECGFLFTTVIKFIFSLILILIAYGYSDYKYFGKTVFFFYLVSFLTAGVIFGSIYFFEENASSFSSMNGILVHIGSVEYSLLLVGVALIIFLGYYGLRFFKKSLLEITREIEINIIKNEKEVSMKAILDTGNHLKDPVSKKPVIITEYNVLRELLPKEFVERIEDDSEVNLVQGFFKHSSYLCDFGVTLVPYKTVGNQDLLFAFKPDKIQIHNGKNLKEVKDVLVGICVKNLSCNFAYKALLHAEIINMI